MANPDKATGSGSQISISTDGKTYKTLGSVTKFSGPNMTRDTVDATDLNSYDNNDQMEESLPGFIKAEDLSFEGFVKKTDEGITALETAFYDGTQCQIKVVLPAAIGKTVIYTGIINAYKAVGDIAADSGISYSAGMKPQKKPEVSATVAGNGG